MSSTNRAFIDAYGATRRQQSTAAPVRGGRPFVAVSERVSAATSLQSASEPADDPPTAAPPSVTPRGLFKLSEGGPPRAKRPLSSVQAEQGDLPGHAYGAEHNGPLWPPACQMLLAAAADQYDAVLRRLPASTGQGVLLGVAGVAPQSGCSTTAICLALRSAALGYSTALVDADFIQPELARMIGVSSYISWAELLETSQPVSSAMISATDIEIDLLLTGPAATGRLAASSRFRASLAAGFLRRRYQRVILDLGHPGAGDDHNATSATDLAAAMGIDHLVAVASPLSTDEQLSTAIANLHQHSLDVTGILEAA